MNKQSVRKALAELESISTKDVVHQQEVERCIQAVCDLLSLLPEDPKPKLSTAFQNQRQQQQQPQIRH